MAESRGQSRPGLKRSRSVVVLADHGALLRKAPTDHALARSSVGAERESQRRHKHRLECGCRSGVFVKGIALAARAPRYAAAAGQSWHVGPPPLSPVLC
ncbi:hypothetical protein NDU88_002994 [Pleurodeles waltl]|uniref:Uncharacterized protein n=1 Tax=Pleurodeles waltl TaxID=8319 RepID=A0AAV7SCI3_PLEWA|nr:hypothetical protein NDU88_002994 [Pleurodeles waltl]